MIEINGRESLESGGIGSRKFGLGEGSGLVGGLRLGFME